jgi:hypothetical protein
MGQMRLSSTPSSRAACTVSVPQVDRCGDTFGSDSADPVDKSIAEGNRLRSKVSQELR